MDKNKELIDHIFQFMPVMHKKIFKNIKHNNSIQKMRLVDIISDEDGKPMKCYANKLMISKPNMTKLVNKLIEEDLVERRSDEKDRRLIKLYVTEVGKEYVRVQREEVKKKLANVVDVLSQEDKDKLIQSLSDAQDILNKLK